jgi:hypothetical protein
VGKQELLYTAGGNGNEYNHYGKQFGDSSKNERWNCPCDPVRPLLGICPKKHETGYSRDTCTLMLIAALFTIAKLWKQPRCPTTDEWIMKLWHIHNGVLLSHEE